MRELGASFDKNNFRPAIHNPIDGSEIKIILDPCHMLKLVRNSLQEKAVLYDNEKRKIEWQYFVRLVLYREKKGLITHKMNQQHIECGANRMKVRLAAELLSRKVSNSMEYLMKSGDDLFVGCAGTINFTRLMNDLFDIFNTSHGDTPEKNNGNIYKIPVTVDTAPQIFNFLDLAERYIDSLFLGKIAILESARKTGFLGFKINIKERNFVQMIIC